MVDVAGHFAMALLFAAPAWFVWGRRGALGFVAFAAVTAMLPDADLVLRHFLPVTHHGVTHTFLFVGVVSVVAGALAARLLTDRINHSRWVRSDSVTREVVFWFATAGLFTGGVSHIFADVLSAPDIAAPLSPFWPVYDQPVIVDVIYYNSPVWNFGLLAVAVAVHVLLARHEDVPLDSRLRIGGRENDAERASPASRDQGHDSGTRPQRPDRD